MVKILIEVDDERIERLNKIKDGPWGVKNLTNDELMILRGKVVQTGEWINFEFTPPDFECCSSLYATCSVCNKRSFHLKKNLSEYCPKCGSPMKVNKEN